MLLTRPITAALVGVENDPHRATAVNSQVIVYRLVLIASLIFNYATAAAFFGAAADAFSGTCLSNRSTISSVV